MSKNNKEKVSIIFQQKNDSPKYFEIKKKYIYVFFIVLPLITIGSAIIAGFSLIQNSPFHLIDKYQQHLKTQNQINSYSNLEKMFFNSMAKNKRLTQEVEKFKTTGEITDSRPVLVEGTTPKPKGELLNPIGLATLSLFRPIDNQKDLTRPAKIGLSGFNLTQNASHIKFHFNIIPTNISDERISGHILVLLKDETSIRVYPANALDPNETQIDYSAGESFLTQRFRPVEASFTNLKNVENYTFIIYIFSKEGDLIHYQPVSMPSK